MNEVNRVFPMMFRSRNVSSATGSVHRAARDVIGSRDRVPSELHRCCSNGRRRRGQTTVTSRS